MIGFSFLMTDEEAEALFDAIIETAARLDAASADPAFDTAQQQQLRAHASFLRGLRAKMCNRRIA